MSYSRGASHNDSFPSLSLEKRGNFFIKEGLNALLELPLAEQGLSGFENIPIIMIQPTTGLFFPI
jgi:hypothetical protein